ncbi:reverse transcriptase [Penicillium italicum]|uniref:Reverse transcriptase n=1 Tax=Penicillium italicum TaxID=40296 RepID=A0A0A2L6D6_PENIT|nr:reverse transcriptase [Penicillium italicum]
MPFRLTNRPVAFQRYINDTLIEYLDNFMIVFVDDILIYSENPKEYKEHI